VKPIQQETIKGRPAWLPLLHLPFFRKLLQFFPYFSTAHATLMHLQKLEIVGFKSFAEKMTIDFLPPTATNKGITAIVGPNGSGKSNAADAIRWVLGEQSLKLLRGKKAEDVIFQGSEKRARCGFAEVTLFLNNEDDRMGLGYSEVTVTRRLYRDGESEYLINKNKVRLTDIQMMLAQANFGARSYSVIGQGMADWILVATPQERKEFFDEAAGVRQFQLKRHQSMLKLEASRENLKQAEMLIAEIEPRLRSLQRSVKRLEERGTIEEELHGLTHQYYGTLWIDLARQMAGRQQTLSKLESEWQGREQVREQALAELAKLEKEETGSDGFSELQQSYVTLNEEKNKLRIREFQLRGKLEVAREVRKQTVTALPLSKIIEEIRFFGEEQGRLFEALKAAKSLEDVEKVIPDLDSLQARVLTLRDRLEKPAAEPAVAAEKVEDPAVVKELADLTAEMASLDNRLRDTQQKIQTFRQAEQEKRSRFFSLQRSLQDKINAAHALERRLADEKVEIARLEARRDALEAEMATELGERAEHAKAEFNPEAETRLDEILPRIQKLKYQLQLIGGIDPEVVKEYEETKNRFDYLDGQTGDLNAAIRDLDKVIAELDETIKARSEAAFRQLNRDFNRYFQVLFGGGRAELIPIRAEDELEDEDAVTDEKKDDGKEKEKGESAEKSAAKEKKSDRVIGIEVSACPPGKKIKNINMLSGGERAMTSIALICAIMVSNPSPFVVLDEVDAALDESNADRYASIIEELAGRTQFIVITHNRYTMKRANVLYGVTMREDGTSMLLSVNLDEVTNLVNKRKMTV
jgi:chromosome segregation protein